MTRVLIDACVLFPTVLRRIVLGYAEAGGFVPLWSERILEEWARAAARHGAFDAQVARSEIAVLRARWPDAIVPPDPAREAEIHLPDPNDAHVLAAAVTGQAGELLTLNLKDFPTRTLAPFGIIRRDPDGFLTEALSVAPDTVAPLVSEIAAQAAQDLGKDLDLRSLLKRARLPRLGKALSPG